MSCVGGQENSTHRIQVSANRAGGLLHGMLEGACGAESDYFLWEWRVGKRKRASTASSEGSDCRGRKVTSTSTSRALTKTTP